MKKILMAEFLEYNSNFKVGNHHYAKQFALNEYEVLWLSPVYNHLYYFKDKNLYKQRRSLHNNSLMKLMIIFMVILHFLQYYMGKCQY
jgi:hypothetical protein